MAQKGERTVMVDSSWNDIHAGVQISKKSSCIFVCFAFCKYYFGTNRFDISGIFHDSNVFGGN